VGVSDDTIGNAPHEGSFYPSQPLTAYHYHSGVYTVRITQNPVKKEAGP
jgi:hypothetical protein